MTFKQLRQQKNRLAKEFKGAINLLRLSREENTRLKKSNQIKDIAITSLEIKEKELSDRIYSLYDDIADTNQLNRDNYQAWLKEHKINRKLRIGLTIMSFIITGLVVALIVVCR